MRTPLRSSAWIARVQGAELPPAITWRQLESTGAMRQVAEMVRERGGNDSAHCRTYGRL